MCDYTPNAIYKAEKNFAAQYFLPDEALISLHRVREVLAKNTSCGWQRLAVWIVAPVLAVFTRWLAEQTEKYSGAQNLVVMREGRLIGKLLKNLYGIPAKEIWINRDVSMRAAFGCGDNEALLNWLVRTRVRPLTVAEAAEQLMVRTPINPSDKMLLSIEDAKQLLANWHKQGLLIDAQKSSTAVAKKLIHYWHNNATTSNKATVLLMDFACAGNIQRGLQTVLAADTDATPIVGLNFLTTAGSIWAKRAGCILHGCLAEDGKPSWMAEAYARTPELIEIFAAAAEGPLQNYTEDGTPICGVSVLTVRQQRLLAETQTAIIEAADFYNREMGAQLDNDLGRCIWGRILLEPMLVEAETMGNWPLDGGLNGTSIRMLAPPLTGNTCAWNKMQTAWPAGSLVRGN